MGRLQKRKSSAYNKKKRKQIGNGGSSRMNGGDNLKAMPETDSKGPDISSGNDREESRKQGAKNKPSAGTMSGLARKKKSVPAAVAGEGYVGKSLQFLREVRAELKRVAWPSRKQTVGSTAVVIILVMVISLFLGMVDLGLSSLIRLVLQ